MLKQYFQSDDFKKLSRNTADSGIKLIFRWGAWAVIGFFDFLKEMLKMAFGSKH